MLSLLLTLLAVHSAKSQTSLDSVVIGIWKGTSICQIKNSPCHDEVVVYYISKAQGIDTIVNGKEEEMGIIGFKLDKKNNRLLSTDYNSLWTLTFKDKDLDGTLYQKGNLYRIIKLKKQ